MNRTQILQALQRDRVFDLVVVGGGATGLGVALHAAVLGYRVALFESHDLASGTSSRSSKLLHGGVRYLAQGHWALVKEALRERGAALALAPHLAQPLPFVMLAKAAWQRPVYGLGLWLYDRMAPGAGQRLGGTEWLSANETRRRLPGLETVDLVGGIQYWDAQFDDARFAVALARTAVREGALVINHCGVTGLLHESQAQGRVRVAGVHVQDHLTGRVWTVRARCVLNAAGVWADSLRQWDHPAERPSVKPLVLPSQGVHLVVDRCHMPSAHALLWPQTSDGRVLFIIPWLGKLLLGTTDTPRSDAPREPQATPDEVEFILREASLALGRTLTRADVRSVWAGLRPLVQPPSLTSGAGTQSVSREHTIERSTHDLVTVAGGKWTTYSAMATDALGKCQQWGLLPTPATNQRDTHLTLVGAEPTGGTRPPTPIWHAPGLHLYGSEAADVALMPGADSELCPGLSEAMVRFAARREGAQTVEDVLARRSRLLMLDAAQAAGVAPRVAALLVEEGCPRPALQAFVLLAAAYQLALLPKCGAESGAQAQHNSIKQLTWPK